MAPNSSAAGPPHRLALKDGVHPGSADEILHELIMQLRNLPGSVPHSPLGTVNAERRRDAYITWAENAETMLGNLTHDQDVTDILYTPRYWVIRDLAPESTRPIPLIESETRAQQASLERLRTDLHARVTRATLATGHIAVLDTNTLLHYEPPHQIVWPEILDQVSVRLVLPLRVIEELDAKKYLAREHIRDRARRLLPQIQQTVGVDGAPGPLRDAVTLEVYLAPGVREKPLDADEEILDTCDELRQFSEQQTISLITADMGLRLRAGARGAIAPICLPDAYRRTESTSPA
jgi:PIN domain